MAWPSFLFIFEGVYFSHKEKIFMKKFLTLRNIVLLSAVLFGLIAFFVSFGSNLTVTLDGNRGTLLNITWGCKIAIYDGKREAIPYEIGPSVLLLIGIIVILVGSLGMAGVGLFLQKPWAKWVVVCCAAVVLTGAIFQFFFVSSFARSFIDAMIKATHADPSPEEYKELLSMVKTQMQNGQPSDVGNVLCGVFGIVAALAAGVSQFLPEKELAK